MITSKGNELIKYVKSLHQKKYRDEYQKYFVEGVKMVKEAISENMPIDKIIICEKFLQESIDTKKYDVEYVNEAVFEYISDTQTPQGIMAIIHIGSGETILDILHKRKAFELLRCTVYTTKHYFCIR